MKNPRRIPRILSQLGKIWKEVPDLRLGQMLQNAFYDYDENDLFFIEDEALIRHLNKFYKK